MALLPASICSVGKFSNEDAHPLLPANLVRRIESNDPSLTSLNITWQLTFEISSEDESKWLGERGSIALARSLSLNTCITSLNLAGNCVGSRGLAALLPALTHLTALTSLNLSNNRLSVEDVARICGAAVAAGMTRLQRLELDNDASLVVGCEAWKQLGLSHDADDIVIINNFSDILKYLFSSDRGAFAESNRHPLLPTELVGRIENSDPSLTSLMIEGNFFKDSLKCLGERGSIALARSLSLNTCITSLNLAGNCVGSRGLAALLPALTHLTALTSLNLSNNRLSVEDVARICGAAVAAGMTRLQRLERLENQNMVLLNACLVVECEAWKQLKMPRPPVGIINRGFNALLRYVFSCSILARFCTAGATGNHEHMCSMQYAKLDVTACNDAVAALRGRQFVVKRSSGAVECDWQLVFGAQVELNKDAVSEVECFQVSGGIFRFVTVQSLRQHNAALFQKFDCGASAGDSSAGMSPLYRAELLYILACQEPDIANKDDATFAEGCARAAYTELCSLKGDNHADTLSCLAALASNLSKQMKIIEARQCFEKCCEGRVVTLGKVHEDTLHIQETFAEFLKGQQEYDTARSLLLECVDVRLKVVGSYHTRTLRSQFRLFEIDFCVDDAAKVAAAAIRLKELLQECMSRNAVEAVNIAHFPSIVRLLASVHGSVALDCASCVACVAAISKKCAPIVNLLRAAATCVQHFDNSIFVPILYTLQSNAESRLLVGLLRVLEAFIDLGRNFCEEHGRNPFFLSLDSLGLSDAVIGLQSSTQGDVSKLANESVVKLGILKMACEDLRAEDLGTVAAACSRLRRMLQASGSDVVAATVLDGDTAGHLVRLLTCARPNLSDDCAAILSLLVDGGCKLRDAAARNKVIFPIIVCLDEALFSEFSGEGQYLVPFRCILTVNTEKRLAVGALLTLQEIYKAGRKRCGEYDCNPSLVIMMQRGLLDMVMGLQSCSDADIKRLATDLGTKLEFCLIYADMRSSEESIQAATVGQLAVSLRECMGDAVVAAALDTGIPFLLVRLLESGAPSVVEDSAACIAMLCTQAKVAAPIAQLLDNAHRRGTTSDGRLFAPLIGVLKSNSKSQQLLGGLLVMQAAVEAGQKRLNEEGRNPCLVSLELLGLSDAVIGLQSSTQGDVSKLANESVVKLGILKMACEDLRAEDLGTVAAACSRLRRMLQASGSDVVAATVLDGDTAGHLVRLLACVITATSEDAAACIGHVCYWAFRDYDSNKKAKIIALVTKSLCDDIFYVTCRDASRFHCFMSAMGSLEGNARIGLVSTMENFLSTYGTDAIIRQLVVSHNIFVTCLDILRSSSSSECLHSVLSILKQILQHGNSPIQGAILSTNPYVLDLNALGIVQVLESVEISRIANSKSVFDEVLRYFYEFLSLEEKLRLYVSQRPVPLSPALQPRPQKLILSSLRGDIRALEADPEWLNIDEKQRIVRFFVSSTFDDTKHERDVLIKCVMPALQRYARSVGFEVVLSEMRFGIRKSLSDDHKTTETCMSELQRCIETSAGLSYMLLSCNRYGFRAPPRRIPACDMDSMTSFMTADERAITLEYYALDTNVLLTPNQCYGISLNLCGASDVAGHAYVLRNISAIPNFWDRFPILQSALRSAAELIWPGALNMHLRDSQSQHPVKFFFISITEEEISRGMLWRDSALVKNSVHVFQRTLQASSGIDLQQMPVHAAELKNYIDLSFDKTSADLDAARLLKEQQEMIALSLSQFPALLTSFPPLEWRDGKGIDPSNSQHVAYLQQFADVALNRLLDSTDEARGRLAVEPHAGMAEAIFHLKFAMHRAKIFAHLHETQHVTTKLRRYLASATGPGHAFVLYGASGSGKTYLMAEAADREAHALGSPVEAVIVRFLGTSPASSNLADLLRSLCKQLHAISAETNAIPPISSDDDDDDDYCSGDSEDVDDGSDEDNDGDDDDADEQDNGFGDDTARFSSFDDVTKLKDYFNHAMKTWQTGRLTVFLDSLDQLDDTYGGRKLGWLPTHDLSPKVRLVVSTLHDELAPADGKPFACLSILQKRYNGSPSDSAMVEVQPVDDVRSLLLHLLKLHRRKLSDAQLKVLEAAIKLSPRTQTPLVVSILAVRFSECPSHLTFPSDNKNSDGSIFVDTSTVRALIIQEFKSLEVKHGTELVRAALSFITLAKDGVSETELSEILSLDDDVLASVYEWWVPPVRTLPTSPLTMLLADLKPYLAMRGAASGCGGLMMRWYHRQFWEAADIYFLHDADERRRRHAQLGEFFSGAWADRSKPYNDRLRAAVQKKVAGEVSGDRRVRPQPLCLRDGKSIFVTKGDAGAVNVRRCREAAHHWLAAGMLCEVADELCSFEGICARARCGEGFELQQQLKILGHRITEGVRSGEIQAARAMHQLCRVEHYARWLQRDMSAIISDPETETITSCSRQPQVSIAREDLKKYLNQTSSNTMFDSGASFRAFVLGPVLQDFDSCVSELQYHKGIVDCVAYNCDSSLLASASSDNTVVIWNTKTGVVECVLKGHTGEVTYVSWLFNSQMLVTGSCVRFRSRKYGVKSVSDNTVRLWDVGAQQEVAILRDYTGDVISVADGKFLALGSRDNTVRLWNVSTQQEVAVLRGLTSCDTVAFDGTGESLAFALQNREWGVNAVYDFTVRLWDVSTQQEIAVLRGHKDEIYSVAFDASGKYLASGSRDNTVRLWDVSTKQEVAVFNVNRGPRVTSVVFDPSGKYLASSFGDTLHGRDYTDHDESYVCVWDVSLKQQIAVLRGHTSHVTSVVFDSSGRYLASGSWDKSVRLWDVSTQQKVAVVRGHTSCIYSVAFDMSGKYLASGSGNGKYRDHDNFVRLWDTSTKEEVSVFIGHEHIVYSVAFDASGKYLASGSRDNTVRLWDVSTQHEIAILRGHSGSVLSVAFDSSGKYLASGSWDNTVILWDVSTKLGIAVLRGHEDHVSSVVFDSSGKYLASGSWDCDVRLWDVSTGKELAVLGLPRSPLASAAPGHTSEVTSVAFDESGKYLASGSEDYSVRLWDVSTLQQVAVLNGHTDNVYSVAFHISGKYLASGSGDNSVRLWNLSTKQEFAVLRGHKQAVRSVVFGRCGKYLASCSDDQSVRLWDWSTQHEVAILSGH